MQHFDFQLTDLEGVAVGKQVIELRTVGGKARLCIEQLAEHALHRGDMFTDGDLPAQLFLQVRRSGKVIGVGMGFQQPGHFQIMGSDIVDQLVGRGIGSAARGGIEIEHRIDDRRFVGRWVAHDIADRISRRIEKARNFGAQRRIGQGAFDQRAGRGEGGIGGTHYPLL